MGQEGHSGNPSRIWSRCPGPRPAAKGPCSRERVGWGWAHCVLSSANIKSIPNGTFLPQTSIQLRGRGDSGPDVPDLPGKAGSASTAVATSTGRHAWHGRQDTRPSAQRPGGRHSNKHNSDVFLNSMLTPKFTFPHYDENVCKRARGTCDSGLILAQGLCNIKKD